MLRAGAVQHGRSFCVYHTLRLCATVSLLLLHQVLFGRAFFKRHGLQAVLAAFLEFEGQFEVRCCEGQLLH